MRKILITGATGFVGSPLCTEMLRQQWHVKAASRARDSFPLSVEPVLVGRIDQATGWTNAVSNVDVVIHLAARVHVMKDTAADPLAEFLKVNLHGTINLARQAADAGVKRLVYVSSIKVNGESTKEAHPFTETDKSNPKDAYAESKWQAEQALHQIAAETGLELVIIRPPLIYGPQVKGNFIRLFKAIDKGIPLPLAAATNIRNLVYVDNLVAALAICAVHKAAAGKTYLVSDGDDISVTMLVEKIAQLLGRNSRSFYVPVSLLRAAGTLLGRSEQVDRLFDSLRISDQKIRTELAWTQPYSLEQGLQATAAWYRSVYPR
jgi:nucleoside-diphosphate-sugar epimerase